MSQTRPPKLSTHWKPLKKGTLTEKDPPKREQPRKLRDKSKQRFVVLRSLFLDYCMKERESGGYCSNMDGLKKHSELVHYNSMPKYTAGASIPLIQFGDPALRHRQTQVHWDLFMVLPPNRPHGFNGIKQPTA